MIRRGLILLLLLFPMGIAAQVEHVPISHPVYNYLLRMETRSFLPHFSLSQLPLQKKQIQDALKKIDDSKLALTEAENEILKRYLYEFEIYERKNAVLIYSASDSIQVFSVEMFGDREKLLYHYEDSSTNVNIYPLGSIDLRFQNNSESRNSTIGTLGFRVHGTIDNHLGYFIQATNGALLGGSRTLALEDNRLRQNVKFADLESDIDFTESHIRYDYKWFYGFVARQKTLIGAGLNQRVFVSLNAPPYDELSLGARWTTFEYRFTHASLLAMPVDEDVSGFALDIPPKYLVMHKFNMRPSWGEFSLWESIIYFDRPFDLAYLNPLTFLKSVEHSLRDRDNSAMGFDFTLRPIGGLQFKGSFLLDDIKFSEIGNGYWSNKYAWNIAGIAALPWNLDIGAEYTRIEPYTYSHFHQQKAMTNDGMRFGSILPPNSDEIALNMQYWWGNRYPIIVNLIYSRHGANIYNEQGELVKNVGGEARYTVRPEDPKTVTFLDGNLIETQALEIGAGWEFIRGFNLQGFYRLENKNDDITHGFQLMLRFGDFF